MKRIFFFLCLFSLIQLQGQKLIKKAFVGPETKYIQIDSKYCYQVDLDTNNINEVKVEASIEGEYSKDLVITIEEQGATVLLSAGFQPNFINPNDKLSAHKVISIKLRITLPEYKEVSVYGTNSNVQVTGDFKSLMVKLSDGRCVLENVTSNVEVTTQKGDILLTVPRGNILAKSTYGEVLKETIPEGEKLYTLNTVEGRIFLKKTK